MRYLPAYLLAVVLFVAWAWKRIGEWDRENEERDAWRRRHP